jgi:hypothetical protein
MTDPEKLRVEGTSVPAVEPAAIAHEKTPSQNDKDEVAVTVPDKIDEDIEAQLEYVSLAADNPNLLMVTKCRSL